MTYGSFDDKHVKIRTRLVFKCFPVSFYDGKLLEFAAQILA